MFSIPVFLAFVIGALSILTIVNAFIRRKKFKKQEEIKRIAKNCEENNIHKNNENCWCSEYDLCKEQIAETFEKHGVQHCGKSASSIIEDSTKNTSISKKWNINISTISSN
ncbi:MAG: hypothetical protein QNK30_16750 [Bacteroidales bacterium]|nr:hypothetical protein [Bacteroidales bacterium]